MLNRVTTRSNCALWAVAATFAVSFLAACGEVPNSEYDNSADAGAESPIACTRDSECVSGLCNKHLGTCEGRSGRDGTSCLPETNDQGCIEIVCGETRTDPICSGRDGTNGMNGQNGKPGADGADGQDGVDGTGCTVARHGNCIIVTCGATSAQAGDCSGTPRPDAEVSEPDAGIPDRNPDADVTESDAASVEVCDRDSDQAPENPEFCDLDGDGFNGGSGGDCDDHNAEVKPGADEACDGVDNNCDGIIDEDCEPNNPPPAAETFVTLGFTLPANTLTDLIALQGCTGSHVDWDSLDGPNGRLMCNSEWSQLGFDDSEQLNLRTLSVNVPLTRCQGVEFNWNFEHLFPYWAFYGDPIQMFGTSTARTSTGQNLTVWLVNNRQDGGNGWIYWDAPECPSL